MSSSETDRVTRVNATSSQDQRRNDGGRLVFNYDTGEVEYVTPTGESRGVSMQTEAAKTWGAVWGDQ